MSTDHYVSAFTTQGLAEMLTELRTCISLIDLHLDRDAADTYADQPLAQDWARVAKASEEVGEAIDALIGITGQNPRKGRYGNMDDLLDELADVCLTGAYGIQHFTKDADRTLGIIVARAAYHRARVGL